MKELFILRLYDMFDGWIDVSKPMSKEEVETLYNEKTNNGTTLTKYADGDYYKVFSADTRMIDTPERRGR